MERYTKEFSILILRGAAACFLAGKYFNYTENLGFLSCWGKDHTICKCCSAQRFTLVRTVYILVERAVVNKANFVRVKIIDSIGTIGNLRGKKWGSIWIESVAKVKNGPLGRSWEGHLH